MNWNEIDIMKLTPEDYLKMRNRCRELEDNKKRQHDHIQELEDALLRMSEAAKESEEKMDVLNKTITTLTIQIQNKDSIIDRFITPPTETYERVVKDADAKIQSANDRTANAKKEAKAAKERAESASERVRYLERKLRDVEGLNDSLMKELARRQDVSTEIREHDADVYQLDVLKYAPEYHDHLLNVIYAAMGMCGEAGEASELVKKYAYHGHTIDSEHLARELGDVLWYVSYMAHLFGYPLGKIMAMNQEKLAKRYPDGKFDAERSRNREEGDI